MSKWKELEELSSEYREQRQIILTRLKRLEEELEVSPDPEYYKELEKRIKLLRSMERDMREIGRESEHYYEKGWWRSEHYTHNARKPRNYSFAAPHETDCTIE